VHTVLSFVGLAVFVVCVVALAAGVTALVVRLSPASESKPRSTS
jgi:hypothetical protein